MPDGILTAAPNAVAANRCRRSQTNRERCEPAHNLCQREHRSSTCRKEDPMQDGLLNHILSDFPFWTGLVSVLLFAYGRFNVSLPDTDELSPPLTPRSFTTAFRFQLAASTYVGFYVAVYMALLFAGSFPALQRFLVSLFGELKTEGRPSARRRGPRSSRWRSRPCRDSAGWTTGCAWCCRTLPASRPRPACWPRRSDLSCMCPSRLTSTTTLHFRRSSLPSRRIRSGSSRSRKPGSTCSRSSRHPRIDATPGSFASIRRSWIRSIRNSRPIPTIRSTWELRAISSDAIAQAFARRRAS